MLDGGTVAPGVLVLVGGPVLVVVVGGPIVVVVVGGPIVVVGVGGPVVVVTVGGPVVVVVAAHAAAVVVMVVKVPGCLSGLNIAASLCIEVNLDLSPFITGESNFPESVVASHDLLSFKTSTSDLTLTGMSLSQYPGV